MLEHRLKAWEIIHRAPFPQRGTVQHLNELVGADGLGGFVLDIDR